jgi:hypothetical protein
MNEIANNAKTNVRFQNFDIKTLNLKQIPKNQKRFKSRNWTSFLLGLIGIGSWVFLTLTFSKAMIKEVLVSGLIITCLLVIRFINQKKTTYFIQNETTESSKNSLN